MIIVAIKQLLNYGMVLMNLDLLIICIGINVGMNLNVDNGLYLQVDRLPKLVRGERRLGC